MLTMVNPIDFGGQISKVKVMMGIIDKCGMRGDATLCIVIFSKRNKNPVLGRCPIEITLSVRLFVCLLKNRLNDFDETW